MISLLVETEKPLQIFLEPLMDTLLNTGLIFPAHRTHVEHFSGYNEVHSLQIFKESLLDTFKSLPMILPAHLTHVEHGKTEKNKMPY